MYLISAYFDEATNKQLQGYIDRISQATGNDFMVAHNVPPHLTLSAIEARSVDVLVPVFEELKGQVKKGEITIITVGQMLMAFQQMEDFKSIDTSIVRLGLAKVNPHEDVRTILL